MDQKQALITVAGVSGLGVLVWLLNRPTSPVSAPTVTGQDGQQIVFQQPDYTTPTTLIPDQKGNTVAFPQPNYTLPNYTGDSAPYVQPSKSPSGVPAPVASQGGGPTYLSFNMPPQIEPNRPTARPDNQPPASNGGNASGGGCSGGCQQSCTTCSDGGGATLATSPMAFAANVAARFPNFARSVVRNINSTGIATPARPQPPEANPVNGMHTYIGVVAQPTEAMHTYIGVVDSLTY